VQIRNGWLIENDRRVPGAVTRIRDTLEHSGPAVHTTSNAATACGISVTTGAGPLEETERVFDNSATTSAEFTFSTETAPMFTPSGFTSTTFG
jgi:hypothetical protein